MSQSTLGGEDLVYVSTKKGRSRGSLHVEEDCRQLAQADEEYIMGRPRSYFDDDREYCKVCTGGEGQ